MIIQGGRLAFDLVGFQHRHEGAICQHSRTTAHLKTISPLFQVELG